MSSKDAKKRAKKLAETLEALNLTQEEYDALGEFVRDKEKKKKKKKEESSDEESGDEQPTSEEESEDEKSE